MKRGDADTQQPPCLDIVPNRWFGPFGWSICPVCGEPWVDHERDQQ